MARPKTPILSPVRIRRAALALVDRDGLDGLSMRKLAAELDVQAASLYSHYRTKDELLQDIANEIMEDVDVSGFTGGDWRHGLTVWARSYRAALAAHPHMVPFIAMGPGRREVSLHRADAVHGGLTGAGWPARQATMIGAATKYLVVGAAISSFSRGFDDDVRVYVNRYPNLSQAHRLSEHAAEIDEESFGLALSAFLDGLEARLAHLPD
ncbi:AcrR family transcriptional regulator [Spinactinospora alkalitolerans]|uniref:AcrR family transcriptional regulator n=1 Tax=Spinactinospora alkalitolerans TaxID=687207 RepID=A0A852TXB7_9ACTN|nr:TetR/AcrR family transcriptional regulator C-terminal domain-containing protein [Spinactinospora alkalitolerans]NYE46500.1 AcrR family transcriptional regulator [Spinactinospora alkalitolerans]